MQKKRRRKTQFWEKSPSEKSKKTPDLKDSAKVLKTEQTEADAIHLPENTRRRDVTLMKLRKFEKNEGKERAMKDPVFGKKPNWKIEENLRFRRLCKSVKDRRNRGGCITLTGKHEKAGLQSDKTANVRENQPEKVQRKTQFWGKNHSEKSKNTPDFKRPPKLS